MLDLVLVDPGWGRAAEMFAYYQDRRPAEGATITGLLRLPAADRGDAPAEVNLPLVGASTTGKNGQFSLSLDPATVSDSYFDDDGAIALTLLVEGSDQEYRGTYNINLYPPAGGRGPWRAGQDLDDKKPKVASSVALKLTLTEAGIGHSEEQSLTGVDFADDLPEPNNAQVDETTEQQNQYGCVDWDQGSVGDFNTIMQTIGTNTSWVSYEYHFNENRASGDALSLGVGSSSNGVTGTFTSSGRTRISSSVELGYSSPENDYGRYHEYTTTDYHKYRVSCGYTSWYELRPHEIQGSSWSSYIGSNYSYGHCTRLDPNRYVQRKDDATIWYTNGVKASGYGSNLEAKNEMEWGQSHRVKFTNTHSSWTRYVCGQHATIGSSSRSGILQGDWKNR